MKSRSIAWTILVSTAGLASMAFAPGVTAQQAASKIPFAQLGAELIKRTGIDTSTTPEKLHQALLDTHFVRVRLGLFDVRFPAAHLRDTRHAAKLSAVAETVVLTQARWLDWATGTVDKSARADIAILQKWIRSWKSKQLARAAIGRERKILALVQTKDEQAAAAARFATYMRCRRWLPEKAYTGNGKTSPLLFAPTRRHFVELIGAIGVISVGYQETLWVDSVRTWTNFWLPKEETQVIALESSSPHEKDRADFTKGFDMNTRSRTGLVEHVAQQIGSVILQNYWGEAGYPMIRSGLAQNLSTAVCGQNNTPSGNVARFVGGRDVFIPGAPSQGGLLPALNADSRWRQDLGRKHFVTMLRRGQKAGARKAKTKTAKQRRFRLQTDDGTHRHVVEAPFLGSFALKTKELVPERFLSDYLEFHRAYKSGFVHWLRTAGGESKKDSARRFVMLLQRLTRESSTADAGTALERIYGVPLSVNGQNTDCLEWRFLAWLSRR